MGIMEERLTLTESRVSGMIASQRTATLQQVQHHKAEVGTPASAASASPAVSAAALRSGPISSVAAPAVPDLRMVQLRVMCRQRGLDPSGTEAELLHRLQSAAAAASSASSSAQSAAAPTSSTAAATASHISQSSPDASVDVSAEDEEEDEGELQYSREQEEAANWEQDADEGHYHYYNDEDEPIEAGEYSEGEGDGEGGMDESGDYDDEVNEG